MKTISTLSGILAFSLGGLGVFELASGRPGTVGSALGWLAAIALINLGASLLAYGWTDTRRALRALWAGLSGRDGGQPVDRRTLAQVAYAIRLTYVAGWASALVGVIAQLGNINSPEQLAWQMGLSLLPLAYAFAISEGIFRPVLAQLKPRAQEAAGG